MGDGILLGSDVKQMDVRFDLAWRRGAADGGSETPIASFTNHFVRRVLGGFLATPFSADADAAAMPVAPGDRLILRITAIAGDPGALFVPNGDGPRAQGQFPRVDLPR